MTDLQIYYGLILVAVVGGATLFLVQRAKRKKEKHALHHYSILKQAREALDTSEYLAVSDIDEWRYRFPEALSAATRPEIADDLPPAKAEQFLVWSKLVLGDRRFVRVLNTAFIKRRLAEMKDVFDRIEEYPLTERQRTAIVTNEDTTLVIAGAGTGKTSTIIGKIDYLVRRRLVRPECILVLAYARKASEELKERLKPNNAATTVEISTFHALGLGIVSQVDGERPSLSKLAEDDRQLKSFIRDRVATMLGQPEGLEPLIMFFATLAYEVQPNDQHASGDNWIRAERIQGLRTLDGTQVKSNEEKQIANWFILNGIKWVYERTYPTQTATPWYRAYQPDFYLPEYDLYLEHFGVDRQNRTAPQVDGPKYLAAMEWKRQLHRDKGTKLIETFSWMSQEGGLIAHLERLLVPYKVRRRPLTEDEINTITAEANRPFSDFVSLLAQFLAVFKGGGANWSAVNARMESDRDKAFLDIFKQIYDAYEQKLARSGQIDFNDMINRARSYVQDGRFNSPYRAIIVDEFQDISENRIGLLRDLCQRQKGCRMFVVGDDWQSIYRFAGSDIGIITHLEERVGATEQVNLDTAFRYPQELLDVTSRFVTANPSQLKKSLRSYHGAHNVLPLCVIFEASMSSTRVSEDQQQVHTKQQTAIQTAFHDISNRLGGAPGTVFILGRYHFNEPKDISVLKKLAKRNNLTVEFMTAHAAKGKEADFVIIVGLEASEYGFPSQVSDDPVMKMVLSSPEPFPFAEERRLFYVAMTRAKRRAYLIAPEINPSPFVSEDLIGDQLASFVEVIGQVSNRYTCPRCGGRTIRRREGANGTFWGCAHYPLCHGKLDACPSCKDGGLEPVVNNQGLVEFRCNVCGFSPERCPRCGKGVLLKRHGQYGPFLGCSSYEGETDCRYTRNLS